MCVGTWRAALRTVLLSAVLVVAAACSSQVVLDHTPPQNCSLGGTWLLDPLDSDAAPKQRDLRRRGFSIAVAAQDFAVLRTRRMLIEQSSDSVGIEYDGGVYRDLSWGVRKRGLWEVNAGWQEDGQLLVLSEAPDAKARETFGLDPTGTRLVVQIEISADGQALELVRTFTRQSP